MKNVALVVLGVGFGAVVYHLFTDAKKEQPLSPPGPLPQAPPAPLPGGLPGSLPGGLTPPAPPVPIPVPVNPPVIPGGFTPPFTPPAPPAPPAPPEPSGPRADYKEGEFLATTEETELKSPIDPIGGLSIYAPPGTILQVVAQRIDGLLVSPAKFDGSVTTEQYVVPPSEFGKVRRMTAQDLIPKNIPSLPGIFPGLG